MTRSHTHASTSTTTSPRIPRLSIVTQTAELAVDEHAPLLSSSALSAEDYDSVVIGGRGRGKGKRREKKPFYRARPLWLVPFALVASLSRGMTLAPRVEVFTQLSCHRVYGIHHPATHISSSGVSATSDLNATLITPSPAAHGRSLLHISTHAPDFPPVLGSWSIVDGGPIFSPASPDDDTYDPDDGTSDPRTIPSQKCISNPDVQAGAARLQMIMTTTMGMLSALTTGWWGHFGERHGRTRVLAGATLGLFLTDLVFILVSTPGSPLSKHGHILLLVAPMIEGALGGWSTLQAATTAYVSDCTSSGSRAQIFSRFTGVTYLGIFFGPSISGFLIQRSNGPGGTKNVTSVFWVAVICEFLNFLAAVFLFPESLDKVKQARAKEEWERAKSRSKGKGKARASTSEDENQSQDDGHREGVGLIAGLLSPLAVFLPVMIRIPGGRMRKDWSLTVLAIAFFCSMLCVGLAQLKYLYAEHVYGWGAEQLSWFISFLGGVRAIVLLLVLPYIIGLFKPKLIEGASKAKSKYGKHKNKGKSVATIDGSKPKPTRSQLGREISFDLTLTRCSFLMDIMSSLLVIASPAPAFRHSSVEGKAGGAGVGHSQALFVIASGLASFGAGAAPAMQSLTLCVLQAREMCEETEIEGDAQGPSAETRNVGGVFGAFAFLQSIGSMILGPMMFGLVYSSTVAVVPKAIFMLAVGTLSVSLVLMMLVRNPVQSGLPNKKGKRRVGTERGRSRASKDLRGGAAGYESV